MPKVQAVLPVLLAFAACVPPKPAASSQSVIGLERSRITIMMPAKSAALDVTRLFSMRGFMLVESAQDEGGITLRFKGERKVVTDQIVDAADVLLAVADTLDAYDRARKGRSPRHYYRPEHLVDVAVGSVFYVRVEPRGTTATSILAIGRPMKDGREACTQDAEIQQWPCDPVMASATLYPELAGFAEAETVEGVFAEMRLDGDVISPDPSVVKAQQAGAIAGPRCQARRRELEELAARVSSPRARAGILGARPTCATPTMSSL